ncbi:uncharacterized protein LOC143595642 [Bidens hawaiensis]|uniref:uncharacterized protein LOC143595642 n=1 Tax=Bidens hawaiensis TaxID=980011 RepID=UPI00404A5579
MMEMKKSFDVHNTSPFSTNMAFKSRQDLLKWVQKVGRSLGYVIVIKRSKTQPSGVTAKVFLMCDCGGIPRSTSSIRNCGSKKINCPFELVGKYSKMYDAWTLMVLCEKHNHEPTLNMKDHPYARRLSDDEARLVFELSRKNVKPQDILSTLKEQNKNNVSSIKTIYNACHKFRKTQYADDKNQAELMETNDVRDDVGLHYDGNYNDTNAQESDDEHVAARPIQPYQEVSFNKPEGQFLMRRFLDGDYESQTNIAIESTNKEKVNISNKKVDSDIEVAIQRDKGEYVVVQSNSDMEEGDPQYDSNQMVSFLTTKSTQSEENERNLRVHNTSAFSTNMAFKSRQDLFDWVKKAGRSLGYVIVTRRSRTLPSGVMNRVYLMCDRGGICKSKSSIRNSGSKKTNCPFQLVGKYWKTYDVWTLTVICEKHNHEPSPYMKDHPYAMRLSANETRLVFDLSRKNVKPQDILSTLKEQSKNNVSSIKTIYNARQKFRKTQHAETFMRQVVNSDERASSNLVDTVYTIDANELKETIGQTDPFAIRNLVQELVSCKCGSGTIDVEDLLTRKQMLMPSFTRVHSHQADLMETNHKEDKKVNNDAGVEIKHNKGEYVGVQSDLDMEDDDSQYDVNLDGDIWKEMTIGLESSKSSKSTKTYYYEGQSHKSRESPDAVLDGVKSPGKEILVGESPGHVDFCVFLNLSPRQKQEVFELKNLARKYKISFEGSAIYVHPDLKSLVKTSQEKKDDDASKIDQILEKSDEREGVKAKFFLNLLYLCTLTGEKLLVFGQFLLPLKFLLRLTMKVKGWRLNKEIFMITEDHNNEERDVAVDQFNNSSDAKVFFGSIKGCGEVLSLIGASRIIILDAHLNPPVTRQAIGRAFRPALVRKVYAYQLVAAGSPEDDDHNTCFRKEPVAAMWLEDNEYGGQNEFEMEKIDVKDCGDQFLETPWLSEDVTALYKRL